MSGLLLSILLEQSDAAKAVKFARAAQEVNLNVWLGSPVGSSGLDDSYVLSCAGAVAAATVNTRIGLFLNARGSATPLRIAEDIGVVDQASNGRLQAAFVAPSENISEWEEDVTALLGAWRYWPTNTGRTLTVTPRPSQPWFPRLVAGGAEAGAIAERLGGGVVRLDSNAPAKPRDRGVALRCVQLVEISTGAGGVRAWLGENPIERVKGLRDLALGAQADELIVRVTGEGLTEKDIETLGVAIAPVLRVAPHRIENVASDAWSWLNEVAPA